MKAHHERFFGRERQRGAAIDPTFEQKHRHRTNEKPTDRENKEDVIVEVVEKNIAQKDYAKES